ncbi:MAG: alcohol dehydrogenase catalytic domain-containing protein, partial [Dehalococcoidia bacterium]|nr:alcohol dehydrogenase catalytic domain-containing protein [Dehalococcoidia bacterium]
MRVAMWYNNRDVRVEEQQTPQIGPGEVLIRIESSGICGSDVMEWYRISRAPLVLGHEVAGTIAAIGDGVDKFKVGDRVTVAHHVPCNTCHYCLSGHHACCDTLRKTNFYPGGFCEYVRIPAINVDRGLFKLPDEMSFEEATFSEPLGCVVRGQRIARIQPGQSVLIIGTGISGILHLATARSMGAGRIIAMDTIKYRLEQALKFGANAVIPTDQDVPAQLRRVNDGLLADLVIICRGAWIPIGLNCVERGGTVLFFGGAREDAKVPNPVNELFWRTEVTLTSSYASPPADTIAAINMIAAGSIPVREMITHRLSLAESGIGFQ